MSLVDYDNSPSSARRIAYNIDEAALATGLGRTTIYKLIGSGQLGSLKIGNRRLIPAHALERLIDERCYSC